MSGQGVTILSKAAHSPLTHVLAQTPVPSRRQQRKPVQLLWTICRTAAWAPLRYRNAAHQEY